jgi:hypothetical protein
VLNQIEQLCSAPQVGCQGIALVRGVLQPKAVEVLMISLHSKLKPKTQMVHLHLLCENIQRIYVVGNKKGEEITLFDPKV